MEEDRRKSQRVPKVATITACCDGEKHVEGAVVNISEKGLCFYSNQPLEPSRVMKVDGVFRLKDFSRECRIVWCTKIGTGLYKVGIVFLDSEQQ